MLCDLDTPRGVPISPLPRQARRDAGVTAAVWGCTVLCDLDTPRDVPIPPRLRRDRRDSVATAAVWGKALSVCL